MSEANWDIELDPAQSDPWVVQVADARFGI
jgi:hypothetical protein